MGVSNTGSVALPAVLRAGDNGGQGAFSEGSLQKAQFSQLSQHPHENGHSPVSSVSGRRMILLTLALTVVSVLSRTYYPSVVNFNT